MLLKIKRFIKNNKKIIIIGVITLIAIISILVLYKSLFYSNSEKATYGVRLRDIEENEFTNKEKKDIQKKASDIEGIKEVDIVVKGRLIKFFVTFEEGVSTDDMKNKFNEMLGFFSEKIAGYYDITFYSKQEQEGKTKYPVTGYKHKNRTEISFDVL